MLKTICYTGCALIAFAANSVLCRLALGQQLIDAASFTSVRLAAGAITLTLIFSIRSFARGQANSDDAPSMLKKSGWWSAFCLFSYAIAFSLAYQWLETGTGALVLFGSVQITILTVSSFSGNRLHPLEWAGVALAFIGLVYLVAPTLTTPTFRGFLLMAFAGGAWGVYTLRGSGSSDPLGDTTANFLRTMPMFALLSVIAIPHMQIQSMGLLYAILSGALASGVGYTVWYVALNGLSPTEAAVVQLLVPVIAAIGGVAFVDEVIGLRLGLAALMILGGILLVILRRQLTISNRR